MQWYVRIHMTNNVTLLQLCLPLIAWTDLFGDNRPTLWLTHMKKKYAIFWNIILYMVRWQACCIWLPLYDLNRSRWVCMVCSMHAMLRCIQCTWCPLGNGGQGMCRGGVICVWNEGLQGGKPHSQLLISPVGGVNGRMSTYLTFCHDTISTTFLTNRRLSKFYWTKSSLMIIIAKFH